MMLSAITMKPSDATQIMPLPTRIVVWPTFAPVTAPRLMLTLRQRGGSRGQIQNGRQPQSSVVVVNVVAVCLRQLQAQQVKQKASGRVLTVIELVIYTHAAQRGMTRFKTV